jgi:hypothetical protein
MRDAMPARLNNYERYAEATDTDSEDKTVATPKGGFQAAKEGWLMTLARYPNLTGADLAVAIVIAKHLNWKKGGVAWPSLRTLARLTNRDVSTVWRAVRKLEQLSLIAVERRRGFNKPNRYRPLLGEIDTDPRVFSRSRKGPPLDADTSENGNDEG